MKKSKLRQLIREILSEKTATEYIVWGIPPNKKEEEILFTKSKSHAEAKKVCDILEKKHGCKKCRVQTIDLSTDPDFKNVFNEATEEQPYTEQVKVLNSLKAGDAVTIYSQVNSTSPVRATKAIVTHSIDDMKKIGTKSPTVMISVRKGGGSIRDYNGEIYWQPTMLTQVVKVLKLEK